VKLIENVINTFPLSMFCLL